MPSSFEDHTPPVSAVTSHTCVQVPEVGSRLADGRYEVMEVLGQGGMSTVLGAFDRQIERPVAIKILHDDGGQAALLDEARMMGAAHSSDVVTVFAIHLDATPPFLVMERVYGTSLDERLREGPIPFSEAMRLLARIAHALDGLHARGIAHGDVKAANVLLEPEGTIKIADLGITPLLRRASSGDVLGTPAYMPPERARGLAVPDDLHVRGDVYSFAVLVFLVMTGRLPFLADSPHELLREHATSAPPRVSEISVVSPAFDAPLQQALAKDPLSRPASPGELMRALERAACGTDELGRSIRILVVDDDDAHRELHCRVIASELPGATVESANGGERALARIAGNPPSILIADLSMPEMSGITLLERALASSPAMRAIVVTGQGSGKEREAAAALGVRHFLIKPVEPSEITRCVSDCIAPHAAG